MNGIGFSPTRLAPPGSRGPTIRQKEAPAPWTPDTMLTRTAGPRWDAADMPLGVLIASIDPDAALLVTPDVIFDVLQDWERLSEGRIRLRLMDPGDSPDSAAIVVNWSDETLVGRDYEVGRTQRCVRANGRITRATITLMKAPLIDQALLPSQRLMRLKATILHEGGHALGLDHSGCQEDVMHHRGWRNTRLSRGDGAQLIQRYC
ncbi:MAG: matrixin family metalloprotease [Vampirovibrionales bacterium]|nr:matrixin family metalloprotease [Vampirovibrionales bacterium]